MTNPKRDDDERPPHLWGIAEEIEKRIDEQSDSNIDSQLESAAEDGELAPAERDELDRIAGALTYLKRVRDTLDQQDHDEPTLTDSGNATPVDGVFAHGYDLIHETASKGLDQVTTSGSLPRRVGRFEIHSILGDGGFARVFLARDPKLDRMVALKIPNPSALISTSSAARFEREAIAAAVLDHPNIVPVFEAGAEGPIHYIASAYCPGSSLQAWFKQQGRQVSPTVAARIIAHLAGAVQHAHQRGVIHRDLKPGNVLIDSGVESGLAAGETQDDSLPIEDLPTGDASHFIDSLRITDFGLAKYDSSEIEVTHEGVIVGTPAYMSPEQAKGNVTVTAKSDVYSLGVMLYELLTGQIPFQGDTNLETLRAIDTDEPTPLRKLNSAIPRDLEAICLCCLSKAPSSRYDTAYALQQDLERWLAGHPVQARRVTSVERTIRWSKRNPWVAIALTFAFLSLATGLSLTTWKWRESSMHLAEANAQRERAERHLELVEDTTDEVMNEIAFSLTEIPMMLSLRRQVLERVLQIQVQLIGEEKESDRVRYQTIEAYRRMAKIHQLLHQGEQSREAFDSAIELIETAEDSNRLNREIQLAYIELHVDQISLATDKRDAEKATELIDAGLAKLADIEPDLEMEERLHWRMKLHRLQGIAFELARDLERSEAEFQRAVEYGNEMREVASPNVGWESELASSLNSLAVVQRKIGKGEIAIENYSAAATLLGQLVEQYPHRIEWQSQLATVQFNVGNYHRSKRRPSLAVGPFEEAVTTTSRLANAFPDHAPFQHAYSSALGGLAYAYDKMGRKSEAAEAIEQALDTAERLPPGYERLTTQLSLTNNLAALKLGDLDDPDAARRLYGDSRELAEAGQKRWPNDEWIRKSQLLAMLGLTDILFLEEDFEAASSLAAQAQDIAMVNIEASPRNPLHQESAGWCLEVIAKSEARLGNFDRSFAAIEAMSEINPESIRLRLMMAESIATSLALLVERGGLEDETTPWVELAIESLQVAIDRGYDNFEQLNSDDDLDPLRSFLAFQDFLESASAK